MTYGKIVVDFLKLKTPKPFVFKGKVLKENALENDKIR